MKILALTLFTLGCAFGQAVYIEPPPAMTVSGTGPNRAVLAASGAHVSICDYPNCSSLSQTYTDATAGTPCPTTAQAVLPGTATCASAVDVRGNFGFWLLTGGQYQYKITMANGIVYGPFPVTMQTNNAGNVQFLSAGAGALPRTLTDKLNEIVSVKDFGAVGNGSANDTAFITAAIAAAPPGSAVRFPRGSYLVSHVAAKTGVMLISDNATLKRIPGSAGALLDFAGVSNSGVTGSLTLDGQEAGSATGVSDNLNITGAASHLFFDDIVSKNAAEDGLYIGLSGTPSDITINNFRSIAASRNGISITQGQRIYIGHAVVSGTIGQAPEDGVDIEPNAFSDVLQDIVFGSIETYSNNVNGFQLLGKLSGVTAQRLGVIIHHLSSHDNGNSGIAVNTNQGASVLSADVYQNAAYGVELASDIQDFRFQGNVYRNGLRGISISLAGQTVQSRGLDFSGTKSFNNSTASVGGTDGLFISSDDASKPVLVTCFACSVYDDQGVHTQRYGLLASSNAVIDGTFTASGNLGGDSLGLTSAKVLLFLSVNGVGYFGPGMLNVQNLIVNNNGTKGLGVDPSGNVGLATTDTAYVAPVQIGNSVPAGGRATNSGTVSMAASGNGPEAVNGLDLIANGSGSGYGLKLYTDNSTNTAGIAGRYNSHAWTKLLSFDYHYNMLGAPTFTCANIAAAVTSGKYAWCSDCTVNATPPNACACGGTGAWVFGSGATAKCPF